MNMNRKACLIIALGLASQLGILLCAGSGLAQSSEMIGVWVRAIAASSAGKEIDPRLGDVRQQLGSLFRYTSYSVISEVRQSVGFRQPVHMNLRDGGCNLTITPATFDKGMIQMSLNIKERNRTTFNTNLRLANRGTLLIGGPRYGEGVVIFAISATVQ